MKKIYVIIFLCLGKHAFCQNNLVFNPGFENYTICPSNFGDISKATGWELCNGGTPDYLNACATNTNLSTPYNVYGYQVPSSGNSYVGLVTYKVPEIITGKLTSPLIVSKKYYVSLRINCAGNKKLCGYSTNKMGIKLSKVRQSNLPIDNTAIFYSNTVVTDTVNWTQLFGSFIADSAYRYLAVGNFFDYNTTTAIASPTVPNQPLGPFGFYLVDDVCISTDSTFTQNFVTNIQENFGRNNYVKFFPNPTANLITVEVQEAASNINYKILNGYGQLILTGVMDNGASLDLSNLAEGIYIIELTYGKSKYYEKVIVQY